MPGQGDGLMTESALCGEKLYGFSVHPDDGCELATSVERRTGIRGFLQKDIGRPGENMRTLDSTQSPSLLVSLAVATPFKIVVQTPPPEKIFLRSLDLSNK